MFNFKRCLLPIAAAASFLVSASGHTTIPVTPQSSTTIVCTVRGDFFGGFS